MKTILDFTELSLVNQLLYIGNPVLNIGTRSYTGVANSHILDEQSLQAMYDCATNEWRRRNQLKGGE